VRKRKRHLFAVGVFPIVCLYVCPEPVLVNRLILFHSYTSPSGANTPKESRVSVSAGDGRSLAAALGVRLRSHAAALTRG
jgi:hypothetical protein